MMRPTADATAVLQRHIAVAHPDARTRPLLRQQWHMRTAAGGAGGATTYRRPSVHREVGMAVAEWGEAVRRSK
jgi:hypothetical protein